MRIHGHRGQETPLDPHAGSLRAARSRSCGIPYKSTAGMATSASVASGHLEVT